MTKNELKYYSSLLNKKSRDEEKRFLTEGKKIVEEGLKSDYECELVIVTKTYYEEHKDLEEYLKTFSCRLEIIGSNDFKKLSGTVTPQGIAAVFKVPRDINTPDEIFKSNLLVALENISDPGNLGTILRNCDWFGITELLLSRDCADIYNPKTIRAAMGSLFHLHIFTRKDLTVSLTKLKQKGYSVLCADLDGKNIYSYEPVKKSAVVFSNEAKGPSNDLLKIADEIITIPKFGRAESLNVASASAVILSNITSRNF